MLETVHNPDQYMYDFRHLITHSRKKIGILVGAGAPVSINVRARSRTYFEHLKRSI